LTICFIFLFIIQEITMSITTNKKTIALAAGVALTAGLALSPALVSAETNPFAAAELSSGYMQLAMHHGEEGKSGEAKCGEGMKKDKEAKCGEHMKGALDKAEEAKCGEGMSSDGDKATEAKCGSM
jgi:uncharacterized low-complexity protein